MYTPSPGIDRDDRLSDESLRRLEKQLKTGRKPSQQVLDQWVKRHGEPALKLIEKYSTPKNDNIET